MSGGGALAFVGGLLVGVALVTRIKQANESTCCQRVAFGARDTIADKAGAAGGLVSGLLDGLGLTKHLPGLLDTFGIPVDF